MSCGSVLVQVADAVAKLINDHRPDSSYTTQRPDATYCPEAVRSYGDFILELDNADELHIDVIPQGLPTDELSTRGDALYLVSIDIVLRYKFKHDESVDGTGRVDMSIVDDLVALTELFLELMQNPLYRRLPDYEPATYKASTIKTIANGDVLRDSRMFLAVIRMSYRVYKDL